MHNCLNMRRLCLGLILVLALADERWLCYSCKVESPVGSPKVTVVPAVLNQTALKIDAAVETALKFDAAVETAVKLDAAVETAVKFVHSSSEMSFTIEKAVAFAKKLKFLGGALELLEELGVLGTDADSARHQQVMNEFAKVNKGIAKLSEQMRFLEENINLRHMETRLFNAFEVLRQAMRLSSLGLREQMLDLCQREQCYHALEQLTRHAPELLDAYIKAIRPNKDYLKEVSAYAHRLVSIVGNSATIVELSMEDADVSYIGLDEMSNKIDNLLEKSKWRWSQIYANIKLDAKALMRQGRHDSNREVLQTLKKELRKKYPWLSLGILVYNDIYSFDKHMTTGHRVDIFHESGKNTVVFVKTKTHDKANRMLEGNCVICTKDNWFYIGTKRASDCRIRSYEFSKFDGTATIKRYEGLVVNMPSDYNYCMVNNPYFTNIAIKI